MSVDRGLIGRSAERLLEQWADDASITANKANRDEEGWDYILQFPFAQSAPESPLDLRKSRITCYVQVKSTTAKQKRARATLSNWEKLVKELSPVFFFIVEYSDDGTLQNAYLVHVWEKWISKVLGRLRRERGEAKLNKKFIYITWSSEDALMSLDGEGLRHAIEFHVGDNMDDYATAKRTKREQVGGPITSLFHAQIVLDSQNYWDEIIDWALGLTPEVKTLRARIEKDIRFDVPAETLKFETEGTLSVKSKGGEATLNFRNRSNTRNIQFAAKVYSPADFFPDDFVQNIPPEHFRERLDFGIGELMIRSSSKEVSLQIKYEMFGERQLLSEHVKQWQLIDLLHRAPDEGFLIEGINKEGKTVFKGELNPGTQPSFDGATLAISRAVDNVWFLVRQFDISLRDEVSLDEILKQQHVLEQLRRTCDPGFPIGELSGLISANFEGSHHGCAVLIVRRIDLVNTTLLVGSALAGKIDVAPAQPPNRQSFVMRHPRMVRLSHKLFFQERDIDIDNFLSALATELHERGFEVIAAL